MAKPSPLTTLAQAAAAGVFGAVGGWILYSKYGVSHHLPLVYAIDTERERFIGSGTGMLSYYADRRGSPDATPLVLIHSINAAGSAYEMRPIFGTYRGKREVYALDLPGFGFSERADVEYSAELYAQAIIDLLERVGQPSDVIALSLGSEFAALAAYERPELFRSLTMISPSGFSIKGASQQASQSGSSDTLYKTFSFPLWGQAFYDLIATRKSIHYFLQKSFEGSVDMGLEEYAYQTTHQPGAHHAPLYFVSGKLFTPDICEQVYEKLKLPVLVLYDRDFFVRFDRLPDVVARYSNWHAVRIAPTLGLPQFEQMPDVARALDAFWAQIAAAEQSH